MFCLICTLDWFHLFSRDSIVHVFWCNSPAILRKELNLELKKICCKYCLVLFVCANQYLLTTNLDWVLNTWRQPILFQDSPLPSDALPCISSLQRLDEQHHWRCIVVRSLSFRFCKTFVKTFSPPDVGAASEARGAFLFSELKSRKSGSFILGSPRKSNHP